MKRMSARASVSLAFLMAATLPLLLFSAAFWPTLREHLDEDIAETTQSLLAAVSMQVSSSVFERPRSVLSAILMLADAGGLPHEKLLDAFAASRPEYAAFFILGPRGAIEAADITDEGIGARLGSGYVLRATPVPGDLAVSAPFSERGHPLLEVSYANPRRTAVGLIDLSAVSSRLVLAGRSPLDRVGVVDAAGRFILCSDPSRIARGTALGAKHAYGSGLTRVVDEGTSFYFSSVPVPGSAWSAVYLRSVQDADAPLRSFLWRMASIFFLSLFGSGALALTLRYTITRPLSYLIASIGMVAAGRYEERVADNPLPEFREIATAFNAMAESIQGRDRAIQRSEERYRLLFHANRVPALLVDVEEGTIDDANDAALSYYGYDGKEMKRLRMDAIDTLDGGRLAAALASSARTGNGYLSRHRLRSGEERDVEVYVGSIAIDESPHFYAVVFDVTRRRLAEDRIAAALEEKTLLLQEVHHRVKNNLQIIASLFNMQAGCSKDEAVALAFRDGQDRVFAMALVHELVYQVDDLSSIDAAEYVARFARHASDAYAVPRDRIELDLSRVFLELERAIPFGLAFNEMLSNAFKYATGPGTGLVRISLRIGPDREEGGEGTPATKVVELLVEDAGPGLPPGSLDEGRSSLGVSIIRALAAQLGGRVAWRPGREGTGVGVSLRFPLVPPDKGRDS